MLELVSGARRDVNDDDVTIEVVRVQWLAGRVVRVWMIVLQRNPATVVGPARQFGRIREGGFKKASLVIEV